MRYLHFLNFELLFQCLLIVIYCYAVVIALIEVSIFYAILPVLLYFLISYISLSPPDEYSVTKVLGANRRAHLQQVNLSKKVGAQDFYPCIAYQAAALDCSEDALSAVKVCYRNGCKFVHIDVRITCDGVLVVGHPKNSIFGSISADKSIEESSFLDLSTSASADKLGTNGPPTLDDVIQLSAVLDLHLMMNVIHSSYYRNIDSTVDIVSGLFQKYPFLPERCVIASTNPWLLHKIRRNNKSIVVALQWRSLSDSSITSISWLKKTPGSHILQRCILEMVDGFALYLLRNFVHSIVGVSAVILPKSSINAGVVEYWERKNVRCIAAIVNLSSEKWYYERALGITYFTETVARSYSNSSF